MSLLDQIRAARETERLAIMPHPGFTDATGLGGGIGVEGALMGAAFEDQIAAMINGADDVDLLQAYQRALGEPGNPEVDGLLAEIERRRLGI